MDLLNKGGYNLRGLAKVNILLGKNGCGKSTALKSINTALVTDGLLSKYLTPERGGQLKHEPGVEHNIVVNGENWALEALRRNQYSQFKEQSVVQYRRLETIVLKGIEKTIALRQNLDYTFDSVVNKINSLLGNIEIRRTDSGFDIYKKAPLTKLDGESISSGESELIALAIECLYFSNKSLAAGVNVLLIDEPDVHLHPDLQVKFAVFLKTLVEESDFIVIIATHSTAFLGALNDYPSARFAFMQNGQMDFTFKQIDETYSRILPIFGAHPLSNLYNKAPILLVEGEDDVRIWQQAIRTSQKQLNLYPCSVDTITNLDAYENEVVEMLASIYDNATGYSLRDRDEEIGEINDKAPLIRFRLGCRNAENLIVSDEVLAALNTNWAEMLERIGMWITSNPKHPKYNDVIGFRDGGYQRKTHQLKEIRNILIGLSGSNKAWEIGVGQTIGRMKMKEIPIDMADNKLANFLGQKLVTNLLI